MFKGYNNTDLICGVQNPNKPRYVAYHHHTMYSNPSTIDSGITPKSFIQKSIEYGNMTVTCCEHGSALSFYEYHSLLNYRKPKEKDGKPVEPDYRHTAKLVYATEAYFVIDNQTTFKNSFVNAKGTNIQKTIKDNTNAHIMLIAKTDKGRKDINYYCSLANELGYYYKARWSLDYLLSLDPKDVMITTACVGGLWKYREKFNPYKDNLKRLAEFENKISILNNNTTEEMHNASIGMLFESEENYEKEKEYYEDNKDKIEEWSVEYDYLDLIKILHNHFGDSFYLEIQPHNTQKQIELNRLIKKLNKELGIKIIVGTDNHMNLEEDIEVRDNFLLSKNIVYEDEAGWILSYHDYNTVVEQLLTQGVFNESEIKEYLDNTLIIETFEEPFVSDDIKLPVIPQLQDKSLKWREQFFKFLIWNKWELKKKELTKINLKYFGKPEVIPFQKYKEGIEYELNEILTSKMSDYFLFNYFMIKLGREKYGGVLTKTGRGSAGSFYLNNLLGFTSMDRFMETIPLLPERFLTSSRILASRSLPDIDFNTASYIPFKKATDDILGINQNYFMITYGETKVKSAFKTYARAKGLDFEIANEITKKIGEYEKAVKHAEKQDDVKIEEFITDEYHLQLIEESKAYKGIIDNISPSPCSFCLLNDDIRREIGITKIKDVLVANITGKEADELKYLKNDVLQVTTVKITNKVCEYLGIEQPNVIELKEMTKDMKDMFSKIYSEGNTVAVNQMEQDSAIKQLKEYKPESLEEISMFAAAIRPSFKSMIDLFLKRKRFDYGISSFDKIMKGEFQASSFVLFQESIMKAMEFAGIPSSETYTVIKAISKKKTEVIEKNKDIFIKGFMEHGQCDEITALKVWKIIEDSAGYGSIVRFM